MIGARLNIIKALENGDLIQKQARFCDLAALDAIPSEIIPYLKLHHHSCDRAIFCNFSKNFIRSS